MAPKQDPKPKFQEGKESYRLHRTPSSAAFRARGARPGRAGSARRQLARCCVRAAQKWRGGAVNAVMKTKNAESVLL